MRFSRGQIAQFGMNRTDPRCSCGLVEVRLGAGGNCSVHSRPLCGGESGLLMWGSAVFLGVVFPSMSEGRNGAVQHDDIRISMGGVNLSGSGVFEWVGERVETIR